MMSLMVRIFVFVVETTTPLGSGYAVHMQYVNPFLCITSNKTTTSVKKQRKFSCEVHLNVQKSHVQGLMHQVGSL